MQAGRMMNRLTGQSAGRLTGPLPLLLALCLIAGGVMPAYAVEPPPEMPHQFYGTVSLDSTPVEEGTLVEAFVDDVKQAETTVDGEGRYGYDPILRVSGTAGATVTFHVGGVEADEYATWQAGDVQELNLTIHEEPAPPVEYKLTISSTTGGSVTIPGEGVFSYYAGAQIQLLAEAEAGYNFVDWTANLTITFADASAANTSFAMPAQSVAVTASFEEVPVPKVITQCATNITSYSAIVNMSYTTGNLSSVEVRFACKRATDQAWFYSAWVSKIADGAHTEVLTGLSSRTEYDVKAQLRHEATVIEGDIRRFTTAPGASPRFCFVTTAAYGSTTAQHIDVLREFRDIVLLQSVTGSHFVALYYHLGPPIADLVARSQLSRTLARKLLVDPVVSIVEATAHMWRR